MEYFVFFSALIAFGAADISLKNSPPYHPSGWRPSGPVPGEYGAPPAPASLQVSQENLRFIGQLVEVTAGAEPKNAYLPPAASPTAAYHQFGQLNAAQVYKNGTCIVRSVSDYCFPLAACLNQSQITCQLGRKESEKSDVQTRKTSDLT